jgi:hypothetical protein
MSNHREAQSAGRHFHNVAGEASRRANRGEGHGDSEPPIRCALIVAAVLSAVALAGCGGSLNEPNLIQQFSANPSTITAGQTTNLSWQVAGVQNVSLSEAAVRL